MASTIILIYVAIILFILASFLEKLHKKNEKVRNLFQNPEKILKKSIWDIPGPIVIPFLGTKWIYLWKYKMSKIHEAYQTMSEIYGNICLEVTPKGIPIVNLFGRDDIEKVLKYPSRYPFRPPTEIVVFYRKSRPDRYASTGIANEQGPTWLHLRTNLTAQIKSPQVLNAFQPILNEVADDFIDLLRSRKNNENDVPNFLDLANLLGLEAVCTLMLGRRMGFLSKDFDVRKNEKIFALEKAVKNLFIAQRDSYYGFGLWKFLPTKTYQEFAQNENIIYDIISEMVENALQDEQLNSDDSDINSVFISILKGDKLDIRDKKSAIIDFIAAGIETMGNTLTFVLYYLSKHPEFQQKIYDEIQLNGEDSKHIYIEACIQETFRISPTAFCIARILEQDTELSNYNIKAGTVILCHTHISSHNSNNFSSPNEFKPERWLNETKDCIKCLEPGVTTVLPFGVGKRTCPGKRFVELELKLFITKLIKNFEIKFNGELDTQFEFLLAPKTPVSISFKDRN